MLDNYENKSDRKTLSFLHMVDIKKVIIEMHVKEGLNGGFFSLGQKKMVAPQRPSANYNPMNISLVRTKDTV